MNPIGIMQGRLSPPEDGRIQSFPVRTWRREFDTAAEVGLSCIEWIYEVGTDRDNPLRSDAGIGDILSAVRASGVAVTSVCADYYMAERLVHPDGSTNPDALTHLSSLIGRSAALGARHIVLPFVDSSSLRSAAEVEGLVKVLDEALRRADACGLELHLETDLNPEALGSLLGRMPHPKLKANYDTGNSASLGYDPEAELSTIGVRLGSVHIKDRVIGGSTVPLGQGAADLPTCFRLFQALEYDGAYILQAAREEGLSEAALAARNLAFVRDLEQAATRPS